VGARHAGWAGRARGREEVGARHVGRASRVMAGPGGTRRWDWPRHGRGRTPAPAGRGPPRAGGSWQGHALAPPAAAHHEPSRRRTLRGGGGERKKARRPWGEHGTTAREREGESGRGGERGCAGAVGEDVGGLGRRDGSLGGMMRGTRTQEAAARACPRSRVWGRGAGAGWAALGYAGEEREGRGPRREVGRGEEGRVALGHAGEADGPRCSSAGRGQGGEVRERGRGPPRPAGHKEMGEGGFPLYFFPFLISI
jgi:hypothetical protein